VLYTSLQRAGVVDLKGSFADLQGSFADL